MFAIIYTAFMTLRFTGHQIKNAFKEQQNIEEGRRKRKEGGNFANVYNDYRGGLRSLETGERVRIDNLFDSESKGKDCFMRDKYGNPIKNISKELRENSYSDAKRQNDTRRTVCKWKRGISKNLTGYNGQPYYSGIEYKDLYNEEIYVCRRIPIPREISGEHNSYGKFYMSIKDGLLVRETDSQKINRTIGKYQLSEKVNQDFITYFNTIQNAEGYINNSKQPRSIGWDGESEFSKSVRMGNFYCNCFESTDEL